MRSSLDHIDFDPQNAIFPHSNARLIKADGMDSSNSSSFSDAMSDGPIASTFADTMLYLSLFSLMIFLILAWLLRKHPIMTIRMPLLVMYETFIYLLTTAILASQSSSQVKHIWYQQPCWLENTIITALTIQCLIVTISRVVLFYRVAQANVISKPVRSEIDLAVHFSGVLFAPIRFQMLEYQILYADQVQKWMESYSSSVINEIRKDQIQTETRDGPDRADTTIGVSSPEYELHGKAKPEPATCLPVSSSIFRMTERRLIHEFSRNNLKLIEGLRWLLKIQLWALFWGLLAFGIQYAELGSSSFLAASQLNSGTCGTGSTKLLSVIYVLMSLFVVSIFMSSMCWVCDMHGLKTELIFLQVGFALWWMANGILRFLDPTAYILYGMNIDLVVMYLHGSVSALCPTVLILARSFSHQYRIMKWNDEKKSDKSPISSLKEFLDFWNTEEGRIQIFDLAKRHFIVDQALFLAESERLDIYTPHLKLKGLYVKYLGPKATFELALPADLRQLVTGLSSSRRISAQSMIHVPHAYDDRAELDRQMSYDSFKRESKTSINKSTNSTGGVGDMIRRALGNWSSTTLHGPSDLPITATDKDSAASDKAKAFALATHVFATNVDIEMIGTSSEHEVYPTDDELRLLTVLTRIRTYVATSMYEHIGPALKPIHC